MTKNIAASIAASLSLLVILGCSQVDRLTGGGSNQNGSLTETGVNAAVGEQKVGIPECDEVLEMIAAEARNEEDSFVTKAVKQAFLNKIRESIKRSIEENQNDKAGLATSCREFKQQIQNYRSGPPSSVTPRPPS